MFVFAVEATAWRSMFSRRRRRWRLWTAE